ncbi:hypothetical protein B7486_10465 [cyanobacterium TDX16]|nr:hypothetical protein B7486_10465 [cyanobacterium TDX16]
MDHMTAKDQAGDPQRKVAVICPSCKQGYRLPGRLLGRKLVCRNCREEFRARELDSSAISQLRANPPATATGSSGSGSGRFGSDLPPSAGANSVAIDTRWAGQQLGRYKVLSVLGQGGMGVVWRGHDDKLRRDVALKILNCSKRGAGRVGSLSTELFMQEARAVAKLQHPGVVSIFEVAEDKGQVFLALELMDGGTLKEYVDQKGPMGPRELFYLMIGPARALALAHERGVIHRDIKPGNLMFDSHGHLKLMDFGLADVRDDETSEKMRGRAVGSLGWIAPETAKGKGTKPVSDVYSMGLVMLYALVGKPLIHANSRSKLIALHQDPPQPDFEKITGLTPAGRSLLEDCLQVDPSKRLSSARALVERLTACAEEDPHEQSRQRRSHASIALVATIFGVVIGMGTVVYYFLDLLERQNQAEMPVVKYASPKIDFEEEPEQTPTAISPVSKADSVAPSTSRFASLKDAKVPWPQVPELIDPSQFKFVGSVHGKVYHLPSSDCGRMIRASNVVLFKTEAEAKDAGRRLCPRCAREVEPRSTKLMAGSGEAE